MLALLKPQTVFGLAPRELLGSPRFGCSGLAGMCHGEAAAPGNSAELSPSWGLGGLIPFPLQRDWAGGGGGLQGLHLLGLFPNTSHRHSWSCPLPVLIPEVWAALETPIPGISIPSPHTSPSEGTLQQIPMRAP